MKIEDFKNRQPFSVPENYFEQFGSNMINILPKEHAAKEKKSRTTALPRIARYISYAAMIVVAFVIGTTLIINTTNNSNNTANEEYYEGEYIDEMLNNYPIDDYTFYCYLTGNEMN